MRARGANAGRWTRCWNAPCCSISKFPIKAKILKLGAVLGSLTLARSGGGSFEGALSELNNLAQGANCLLGHNLVRHDLPILRERAPELPILRLPIIDTLVLSPICFPENPYHRLIKDYKLVRESVNDPVADARQAAILFADEFRSLDGLRRTEPRLFELLYFLLATPGQSECDPLAMGNGIGVSSPWWRKARKTTGAGDLRGDVRALGLCERAGGRTPFAVKCAAAGVGLWDHLVAGRGSNWCSAVGALQHPAAGDLIRRLREVPCRSESCAYCRKAHNAREQLRSFLGWEDFRPLPPTNRRQPAK